MRVDEFANLIHGAVELRERDEQYIVPVTVVRLNLPEIKSTDHGFHLFLTRVHELRQTTRHSFDQISIVLFQTCCGLSA